MKNSYLLAGIKTSNLISMIIRNKGFSIKYFPRILFLLNAGLWSSVFAFVERFKYKQKLSTFKYESKPVFIIGNWRTGTTFLHQLLALDPQFTAPTVYQVSNPDHMLVSEKYYIPIMTKVLGKTRPMDNVKIGADEPQEDEYALLKLCKNLPLEKLIFPKSDTCFLENKNNFLPENEKRFAEALKLLEKKIVFLTKKRVVFKNPFHSLRIPLIRKTFPNAVFIHIYRNPKDVLPSSVNMWNIVGKQNILKGKRKNLDIKTILNTYKNIILTVRKEFELLNNSQKAEIQFEELEQDPTTSIKKIYNKLNIEFTPLYEKKINEFCNKIKGYTKNKYQISKEEKIMTEKIFSEILPEYF